jgi:very-short-patch-repair endonuclease
MARIKSLKELGKGSWKIASISPVKKTPAAKKLKSGQEPQSILYEAVRKRWPEAVEEYPAKVPGRKFRIDIAFVDKLVAAECDGWSYHGRHLADFKRDRRRQNLLVIHGWRVLRFTSEDIHKDLEGCLEQIEISLSNAK